MEIQNSYIFLPKRERITSKDGKININSFNNLDTFLLKNFKLPTNNKDNKFNTNITVNNNKFNVYFIINHVKETIYLDVGVIHNDNKQAIECMEYIHSIIYNKSLEINYNIIISYDAISEYYCNLIYPKLNELERTLRKLMFNIYIFNFGREYYKATIPEKLQNDIKKIIKTKNEKERLSNFFYCCNYYDLEYILFNKDITTVEKKFLNSFLNQNSDLSELNDKQLRDAFKRITPKSDFERFFADKFDNDNINDIYKLIKQIHNKRNNVAHCKFFYKNDYDICKDSINELLTALNKAIKITEEKDFKQKNKVMLSESFKRLSEKIKQIQKNAISPQFFENIKQIQENIISPQLSERIKQIQENIISPQLSENFKYIQEKPVSDFEEKIEDEFSNT